ncbi:MAG: membrane dipeptidase [Lachnospiraceae bacterium]|nr:membrane dipeptidase [Lachnospiraceae bacterium]
MSYIDLHCDTLMKAFFGGETDIYAIRDTHVNVKKLKEAGVRAQFFAVFFPRREEGGKTHFGEMPEDLMYFTAMRQILFDTIKNHSEEIAFAENGEELAQNVREGKVSAFLTLEDGRAVDGSVERLLWFYEQGVRLITLTWNDENCFGAPNSRNPAIMQKGLTAFGKEAIAVMNEKGILIDVSHLSDGGFRDVAELTKKPFVASHSNTRSLAPHPRNLTDGMIRTLAEKGGVAGLNFYGPFLNADVQSEASTLERMAAHAMHMYRVGGEDVIAIGTDFDGFEGEEGMLEIDGPGQMERLFDRLRENGFSGRMLDKFQYGNVERVIRDVL